MSAPTLSLTGVSKRWRGAPAPVLSGVDLEISAGSITWIVGRNGVGKTTLLRVVSALILPDSGHVRVCGIDPERQRRDFQRQIGFLPAATSGLYARMTGRQHLQYWAKLALMSRSDRTTAIARAIEDFGLHDICDRRVDRLSMGQRQRLRLGMTFMHRPALLLLDEPRNSLDDEGVAILAGAISAATARGSAAIWCSPTGDRIEAEPTSTLQLVEGKLVPQEQLVSP